MDLPPFFPLSSASGFLISNRTMRFVRGGFAAIGWLALLGCGPRRVAPVHGPMPPNTVLLSTMMQQLSRQPGFTEKFLAEVEGQQKKPGAALLTPELLHHLRDLILGRDWSGLDHFPGWTMEAINPTVRVIGHFAGKDAKVGTIATAGGAPGSAEQQKSAGDAAALRFIDLGPYGVGDAETVDLSKSPAANPFRAAEYVSTIGAGVTRGDGPNAELAPLHAQSARLAEVMNRLSLNGLEETEQFHAVVGGRKVASPEQLMAALEAAGHTIELDDARYFANFGHLHLNGQDVMMPFWVNTQIAIPEGGWIPEGVRTWMPTWLPGSARPLLVPVSHAEYEWRIRGPQVNAAISFYFGIDGKAEFRTMDQLDQAWVGRRAAHTYAGADDLEVTRLAGEMVVAYTHLHQAHPDIPFGGYYAFGVCQDVVAAIEKKITGRTTLFPNTADDRFFINARDAEVNNLIRSLPKDRDGRPAEVERIFGSLPVGSSDAELAETSIPGLGAQLIAVHDAWTRGTVDRTLSAWALLVRYAALLLVAVIAAVLIGLWRWRNSAAQHVAESRKNG